MTFLTLHITCSCTLHAYVPPFSIILILIVFGASLSLSVSCFMAPKRKSTSSWNPLHSEASSSSSLSDPTPSHIKLHDDKACKNFLENFS